MYVFRPFVVDETTGEFVPGPPELWFDTRAQNLGTVPVQLTIDEVESSESSTVSQCVSWTAGRICREQRPVGGFAWHEEHTHFHFTEFAAYEFRRLAADGRPDYSEAGLIAVSDKVSFCLLDSEQVDPNAAPVGTYKQCTATVQGISPGWTDVYDFDVAGQQFQLAGLSDGRYALVVRMNYANRLLETTAADNVVEVTLEISGDVSHVEILGRRYV